MLHYAMLFLFIKIMVGCQQQFAVSYLLHCVFIVNVISYCWLLAFIELNFSLHCS